MKKTWLCKALAVCCVLLAVSLGAIAEAGQIPHTEVEIKYPAIIDVDESVYANKAYKIGYANWSDENSIAIIVRESIVEACKYYGLECVVFDNDCDPNKAMANADNAIVMECDYYLNFNNDEAINAACAEKLAAAGIPYISIQNAARKGIDPEYHVDNQRAGSICGELLAQKAKEQWPDENPVLLVANQWTAGGTFLLRANSCEEAVKAAYPDIEIYEIETQSNPETTRQATADFLTAHPEGKILMWCHIDQNTMGMLAAVRAAGREDDVLIASFGANPVAFEELKSDNSPLIGTVAQFSERFGWDIIPMVIKHLNGEQEPPLETMPPLDIITKDSLYIYYPDA